MIELILIGLLIFFLLRDGKKAAGRSVEGRLAERNRSWVSFITSYRTIAKGKSEQALIDRMLADAAEQGLVASAGTITPGQFSEPAKQEEAVALVAATSSGEYEVEPVLSVPAVRMPKVELDNVSLLLYFGAFLFVASVGLFIAFGGANGAVRTIAVLVVMGVLYGGGIWLFHNKPKLSQAGVAFSGIGMTIAPLAGVAAYYYLFLETNGPVIWFITSLLCLGMYVHALQTFRRPLISYLLIFTFLSLFESGVSIIDAPIYYFGWAMALVGIILTVASRLRGFWPEMQESSRASSQLILPLSVLTSLALVPTQGAGQLGVSLLFAAAYYGLETLNTAGSEQEMNAATTQITAVGGLLCLSYAAGDSWKVVAFSLLLINIVQILAILLLPQRGKLWRNFGSIVMGAAAVGIVLAWANPGILLAAVAVLAVSGIIIWQRQQRTEAYVISMVAWMALPVVLGQVFLPLRLDAASQAIILLSALAVQLGVYLWYKPRADDALWPASAQPVYVLSATAVIVAALFASAWLCFVVTLLVVASMVLLAEYEDDGDWAVVAGLMVSVPAIRAIGTPSTLVAATLSALLLNIGLALKYREEPNRWFSTVLWLALPLALGSGWLGSWTAASYAWTYLGVMLALILSRAIARGSVLLSDKIPLASYARNASVAYVAGYCLAAVASVGTALASVNSRVHATVILTVMIGLVYGLSRYVEKRSDVMVLLPLLAQAVLLSALRPVTGEESMSLYLLFATVLAVVSYFIVVDDASQAQPGQAGIIPVRQGALLAVFVSPAAVFVVGELLWPMPLGLLVAGGLLYFHLRNTSQQNRELAGGVIVAAVLWFMWLAGVREVQAYTHVLVATLAAYAYWRALRHETVQSDQYILYMLLMATVPLGLQALSGQAGGLYGWWLLLEQIGFMLIGMAIKKRLVTLWGLYVAVGAVLYQLRDLGWAALTVLAMFLIGIAVYKLQRPSDKS